MKEQVQGNLGRMFMRAFAIMAILFMGGAASAAISNGRSSPLPPSPIDELFPDLNPSCWIHGGEVPIPFEDLNQKVELADGEYYLLIGQISMDAPTFGIRQTPRPFIQIDLDEHPWLGNSKRKKNPYYPIIGLASEWRKYEGHRVMLYGQAQWVVRIDEDGIPRVTIWIEPLRMKSQPKY